MANIEHAQVDALGRAIFRDADPSTDLLSCDLWTIGIASSVNQGALNRAARSEVATLAQANAAIDRAFERHGPKAIAVKDQSAYSRDLNYTHVPDAGAAPIFARFHKDPGALMPAEIKAADPPHERPSPRCPALRHRACSAL